MKKEPPFPDYAMIGTRTNGSNLETMRGPMLSTAWWNQVDPERMLREMSKNHPGWDWRIEYKPTDIKIAPQPTPSFTNRACVDCGEWAASGGPRCEDCQEDSELD